jgi:hypothetical protein
LDDFLWICGGTLSMLMDMQDQAWAFELRTLYR